MIDFKLNDIGDIEIGSSYNSPMLNLSFCINAQNVLKLSFDTVTQEDTNNINDALNLSFNTMLYATDELYKINDITEDEEFEQEIRIRLNTQLGEIKNRDTIGSLLYTELHSDLNTDKGIALIEEMAKNALSDIWDNVTVTAKVERNEDAKSFYLQSITLYLTDGDSSYTYII